MLNRCTELPSIELRPQIRQRHVVNSVAVCRWARNLAQYRIRAVKANRIELNTRRFDDVCGGDGDGGATMLIGLRPVGHQHHDLRHLTRSAIGAAQGVVRVLQAGGNIGEAGAVHIDHALDTKHHIVRVAREAAVGRRVVIKRHKGHTHRIVSERKAEDQFADHHHRLRPPRAHARRFIDGDGKVERRGARGRERRRGRRWRRAVAAAARIWTSVSHLAAKRGVCAKACDLRAIHVDAANLKSGMD